MKTYKGENSILTLHSPSLNFEIPCHMMMQQADLSSTWTSSLPGPLELYVTPKGCIEYTSEDSISCVLADEN